MMDNKRLIKLRWYSDSAHGWLSITKRDAKFLNILDSITPYSYQSEAGNVIYCEEDNDAPLVLSAILGRNDCIVQFLPDHRSNYLPSHVRQLQHYRRSILANQTTNSEVSDAR